MFGSPWKLGRVAGIDLFLHPTFLLVPVYILSRGGGLFGLAFATLLFGSVLLHELGHALMARYYGIATANITLYPIGGVARLERMPRSAGPELLIALAGPAVNLAIAAVAWPLLVLVSPSIPSVELVEFLEVLVYVNIGLLVFNLVPAFPMDGGRVLRAALSGWLGRLRATEVAAGLGRVLAVAGGAYFLFSGEWIQVFLAAFIFVAGTQELWAVRIDERRRRAEDGWPEPPLGYRWVDRGDGVWRLAPIGLNLGQRIGARPWR